MKSLQFKQFGFAVLGITLLGLTSPPLLAAVTVAVGGALERTISIQETTARATDVEAFATLPTAAISISLAAGQTRLLKARFSGESACFDTPGDTEAAWCALRIVVINTGSGAVTEMNAAVGADFAFDSTGGGTERDASWESHSIDRTLRIPAASQNTTYRVVAEWAIVNNLAGSTTFRIDDWNFNLDIHL